MRKSIPILRNSRILHNAPIGAATHRPKRYRRVALPKQILIPLRCRFSNEFFFWLVFFSLLLTANNAQSQSKDPNVNQHQNSTTSSSPRELLLDHIGEHWRAVSPIRNLDANQISALPDADIYSEYGLQRISKRVYAKGKVKATVEIFEMGVISGAYGLFTFQRGHLQPNTHEFYVGRYLVRISNAPPSAVPDQSLVEAIKPNLIGEAGQFPFLPSHLPEQDKIVGSEKYIVGPTALSNLNNFGVLKSVINFDGGVEVVTADYRNGNEQMSLIIIEYHTPQSASDGYARIQSYFHTLPQQEKDRRILKRIGNYIVEAVNVQDLTSAQNIVGQIKYEAKVYWTGRNMSDIPPEFRPPDPVAIEEAIRTTQVLLRSFYWIGAMLLSAMLLGIVAGGSVFYWNRYRRRKLGLDDMFSDAGGTIRLNLDDYLLSSDEPAIKQIGRGDNQI